MADIVLMGPGVLAHGFEATPLVRREVAVAAQAVQDVGLVGVEYAMLWFVIAMRPIRTDNRAIPSGPLARPARASLAPIQCCWNS
ncbi:hypothetical protein OG585_45075 [Streptomyces sp. NBC_01340]|uniref:hypothetical protein n=1 Tax=unclassified Streptomyces TaxID=2593676 RepID=UPI00224ED5D0|nr:MULTISPECIES: hypothetical protein [unclassified Streptomyces]MCX4459900.1 hypothetical protein [Streptomyces sp. NBC_01719]MCX4499258.1 hypothetical protein [Streptomyces sp. NBC_01728]MCX4594821.1 hypothetical protein [Streptomyces sp. NBC_01549]WSI36151.1 hypothetical protein OG585_01845 [Streptomyces sp. NBC_01340]WSI43662.1 hypothetical protein OG585_45075 [Streptomyces sp. NBC_01340]